MKCQNIISKKVFLIISAKNDIWVLVFLNDLSALANMMFMTFKDFYTGVQFFSNILPRVF